MNDIDVSKIPADVMAKAEKLAGDLHIGSDAAFLPENYLAKIALAILQERADCAQHAFRMRWAPSPEIAGTKNATMISQITTDWSQKIGMSILNRSDA